MDGFDDLLPSRDIQNPFAEDPFAKRSNSPDPWASPFAQAAGSTFNDNAWGAPTSPTDLAHNAFTDVATSDPPASHNTHADEPEAAAEQAASPTVEHAPDPLDTAAFNAAEAAAAAEEEAARATSPLSRGFRESISTETEEPPKPSEPEPAPIAKVTTPPAQEPVKAATPPPARRTSIAEVPNRALGHSSSASTASFASSKAASVKAAPIAYNPLDRPSGTLERSIAGLSIGGEALGGWQGADGWQTQSTFAAPEAAAPVWSQSRSMSDDDDDDDDEPIAQTIAKRAASREAAQRAASPSGSISVSSAVKKENGIQPVFVITVDDPQRVGDPIRAYTMYTVHTKTTSPLYKKSSFSVLRRYSDFLWLYETLSMNNPGVVVPPVPGKNTFGRFDEDFVQQRRLALEKCIQKTANHPVLQKDQDLKLFLESDTFALDIKHRKAEIAQEKGGLIAVLGQTIAGPRFYETDEWFDRQKSYLDSLETQLRGLVKAIDTVAKQRADIATAAGEFAQAIADLAQCDVGNQLSASLAGLADVERKVQELQTLQSNDDVVTILSTADEYARLINSVRLAFSSRIRVYHAWQNADANLRRVKQSHESNRAQGRLASDQLSRSLALVAEAERRALDAKQEFDHVSRLAKTEVARFEQERIDDFKNALEAFLEGMISRQKQLIAAWESYQQSLLKRVVPQGQQRPPDSPISMTS